MRLLALIFTLPTLIAGIGVLASKKYRTQEGWPLAMLLTSVILWSGAIAFEAIDNCQKLQYCLEEWGVRPLNFASGSVLLGAICLLGYVWNRMMGR